MWRAQLERAVSDGVASGAQVRHMQANRKPCSSGSKARRQTGRAKACAWYDVQERRRVVVGMQVRHMQANRKLCSSGFKVRRQTGRAKACAWCDVQERRRVVVGMQVRCVPVNRVGAR